MKLLVTFIIAYLALHTGTEAVALENKVFNNAFSLFSDVLTKTQETVKNVRDHAKEFFEKAEGALKETVGELDRSIHKKLADLKAEWAKFKSEYPAAYALGSLLDGVKAQCFGTSMNVMAELTKRVGEFSWRANKKADELLKELMTDVTLAIQKVKMLADSNHPNAKKCAEEVSSKLLRVPGTPTAKLLGCVDEFTALIHDKIKDVKEELKKILVFIEKLVNEAKECAAQLHPSDKPGPPQEVPCLLELSKQAVLESKDLIAGIFKTASQCVTEIDKLMVDSERCSRRASLEAKVQLEDDLLGVGKCMQA